MPAEWKRVADEVAPWNRERTAERGVGVGIVTSGYSFAGIDLSADLVTYKVCAFFAIEEKPTYGIRIITP